MGILLLSRHMQKSKPPPRWRCDVLALLGPCAMLLISLLCFSAHAEPLGRFEGDLVLKVLPDGENMELTKPFKYIDSHGVDWPVPAFFRVDGASIPRPLWSIIGSPFTGKYREASVIHDFYCETESRHWRAVHKVFHDGMLARGVDPVLAKTMYLAVYRFGPRWDYDADACFCKGCPVCANPKIKKIKTYRPDYKESDFETLKRRMTDSKTTLQDLEDLADYQVNSEIFSK